MELTFQVKGSAPSRGGHIRQKAVIQWHPRCRAPLRAAELRRKTSSQGQHGTVCMVAAVDAPEAHKDKQEHTQQHQGPSAEPSAKHLRREEAILFQGDHGHPNALRHQDQVIIPQHSTGAAPTYQPGFSTAVTAIQGLVGTAAKQETGGML